MIKAPSWIENAVFYHVYPLGACGAPARNDLRLPPRDRLSNLLSYLDHWQSMGITALYLGPLFESRAHGYDTADYFRVDRRLGDNTVLQELIAKLHDRGMRVILDGVFHHVGREFWAFRELQQHGDASPYQNWFSGVRFDARSALGDPFGYDCWEGCHDLVKLNLRHPEVREHLLGAVDAWVREFDIDGLRLDVAERIDTDFLRELAGYSRSLRDDFWLMGEMIHGDYRRIAAPDLLNSATNYECYKGMWSSLNDGNFFEIAHSLNRLFGAHGLYRNLMLYNFVDNHDVDRAATILNNPRQLALLYLLLFTIPGVPSIYYGSEWGLQGRKEHGDRALRPTLPPLTAVQNLPAPEFPETIASLSQARHGSVALRFGCYRELYVRSRQLAFARTCDDETIIVACNAEADSAEVVLPAQTLGQGTLTDVLHPSFQVAVESNRDACVEVPAQWGRVLRWQA